MKYAVIADIHANLEAFQAVLEDAKKQQCGHYAFLGDFVGYCANPKACLEIVRSMNAPCVKGEHDEWCATELPLESGEPNAMKALQWARAQLTEEDLQWLRNLPHIRTVEDFTIVHATLDMPKKWRYAFDKGAVADSFAYQNSRLCFCGHTHVPVAFIRDSRVRGGSYSNLRLEPGGEYSVNVGAVGQPRDGNPKAGYVIYDMEEGSIELRRLDYDIAAAQKKIHDAGLPPRLAERLALGK
jgi:diadenosine tetraphosphatase ApaH/serine/threonine PP2A family protein phosphatase